MMWNPSSAPAKLLPRPKDHEQFEELTAELFGAVYEVDLPSRHARSGQPQDGVDVLLDTAKGRVGIQCKLHRSERVGESQLVRELEAEVEKARKFRPALTTFVFATSARRDGGAQRRASELAEDAPFEIRTFFWDDFGEYLPRHRTVYDWYLGLHHPDLAAGRDEPTFEEQLRKWRAHVRRQTRTVDPFVGEEGEAPRLDRVFVRREVGKEQRGGPGEDADQPEQMDRPGSLDGDHTLREVLALDPADDPRVTGKWVLLGDPGSGKTTLLRHLAREVMAAEEPEWVPLRLHLSEVVGRGDWLQAECERAGVGERFFDRVDRDGRLLLLLDGLDELTKDRRVDGRELARSVRESWPRATVVVASRLTPYDPLGDGFVELRVQPLSEESRTELLAFYLSEWGAGGRTEAEQHLEHLESDPWLRELTTNPLSLTLLALLLRQGITPAGSRAKLFRQIFDLLIAGDHRRPSRPFEPTAVCRELLRRLAHGMAAAADEQIARDELEERLTSDELDPLMQRVWRQPGYALDLTKAQERFFDGLERTGILVPCAPEQWHFWHRNFREALAAERLAEEVKDEPSRAVDLVQELGDTWDKGVWSETMSLLPGHLDDAEARDAVVQALFEQDFDLGLRSLGAVERLSRAEASRIFRQTVEWRLEQITPQLLRLLPDDELLTFIESEKETRNGDRLFWLLWLLRQVELRGGAPVRDVEALRDRFFEHIPPPPVELFTKVETRDGEVDLWCAVEPGKFWMGSPKSEEGHAESEHPRHLVEFLSGFRMAAVPVTQAQYATFDPKHRSSGFGGVPEEEMERHPVNEVSWYAAMAFCQWLSQALPETAGARLPTEAEWEYACRAGTETAYWRGDGEEALREVGWYDGNSEGRTHPVGELPANDFDLHDTHGNVFEWTVSRWTGDYAHRTDGIEEDPASISPTEEIDALPAGGGGRVIRGGSYASDARNARSAYRNGDHPRNEWQLRGFRVVLPAAPSGGP